MAATPFDASTPGPSFVFDIYNDGQALRNMPALPGGPCNYTDQTLPRCGCRRFWSRLSLRAGLQDSAASNLTEVCMCSHHACFHEDVPPPGQVQPPAGVTVTGQENQRPKSIREPLSPVQDPGSFHIPSNFGSSLDFDLMKFQSSMLGLHPDIANPLPTEDNQGNGHDSPMPDTLNSWGDLIQSQPGHSNSLPPLPPECLLPSSQPPSTASSSQARYLKPFSGRGLHTLSGISATRHEAPPPKGGHENAAADTTPCPVRNGFTSMDPPARIARDAVTPLGISQGSTASGGAGDAFQKLANTVDSHEQRIDRLENTSFSVASHEDCSDKHEHVDLRVTELESRVEEVEKILNDNSSVGSSRRTVRPEGLVDDGTASVVSVSTNATGPISNRAEMYSQLRSLQAQVSQLQAASLPSYTKPWELEVVFLPFPLRGIWMEARDFQLQRRSTGSNVDEWTQLPNTLSRATPDPQSPKLYTEWAGQSADSNWLLPRAFAPGRIIDQRLKSRGLIKAVLVRGPDARSIQHAVHDAFGDIFRISSNAGMRSAYGPSTPLAEFLGLRQSWVPLRKLHKDSRLRFLSPSEMATPALWDFTFLVSSIVMKSCGVHRLYITQPQAYLQDQPLGYQTFESGWSWQKLRELSRIYPDSQSSSGDIPEADAMEECWTWDDRLDESPSANTSALSIRQMHQQRMSRRSSTSPSQQFFTGVQSPILSNSPGFGRAQSPFIQREQMDSRPLHVRTNSLPPITPALISPSQSRRRVASHATSSTPYDRRSSPQISRSSPRLSVHGGTVGFAAPAAIVSKRHLGTRSPSVVARNTPRWSRTSMSRSPSVPPLPQERRTTPFFYATPYSEALPDQGYRAGSRGPLVMLPSDGYDPDDDEDMDDDVAGSATDPYESEMTNDDIAPARKSAAAGSFGSGDFNANFDTNVYEDEDDDDEELDGGDTDAGGAKAMDGFEQRHVSASPTFTRPEDIPWAGIEEDPMSDGENVDPTSQEGDDIVIHEDDDMDDDDTSSQAPSEYSSKQNAWQQPAEASLGLGGDGSSGGFRIHEDGLGSQ
ncbi:hypothetical protein B0H63DRAFT_436561 [Podospora didyma]|uniref:Uncharacterized protein n=1 Tax=Podospora didyma TaxID=330526 RepID=A0AAE0NCB0_9PEZI|nr:hypothetical protein B0H63DRAFT_436561 [Podospora didyma]